MKRKSNYDRILYEMILMGGTVIITYLRPYSLVDK